MAIVPSGMGVMVIIDGRGRGRGRAPEQQPKDGWRQSVFDLKAFDT